MSCPVIYKTTYEYRLFYFLSLISEMTCYCVQTKPQVYMLICAAHMHFHHLCLPTIWKSK